jgi:hypothetical protein
VDTTLKRANASRVIQHLWIGGDLEITDPELASGQLDDLEAAGITAIIDCRIEWNDEDWVTVAKPHIGYNWLGVDDAGQAMPGEWFDAGTEYALDHLQAGGTVLAHCHMGINRGPSLGFAIMLTLGWEPLAALDRIRQARPIAHVGYAEDALDWWMRRRGSSELERRSAQAELRRWRLENWIDAAGIIRRLRKQGA